MTKKKKFYLIFHGRFPSEKAAGLFAAKSCESFAREGIPVTLLVPRRLGTKSEDPYQFYRIEKNFSVVYLPTVDLFNVPLLRKIAFGISYIVFSLACFFYLLIHGQKNDIIYSNELIPLLLGTFSFPETLYELHDFPENKIFFYRSLFKRVKWILVTNKLKVEKLKKEFHISDSKTFHEPNAVEIPDFDIKTTKKEARKILQLPEHGGIAVYTGHLYDWKGVDVLAESARKLSAGSKIFFVGGTTSDVESFKSKYADIQAVEIVGHRPHEEIPLWQRAADVLVLPNTGKMTISKYYTSPMKLFEYMASSTPIIASDIPSIRNIVDENMVLFVPPDDEKALSEAIVAVFNDASIGIEKARFAWKEIEQYSWQNRARRIIKNIDG